MAKLNDDKFNPFADATPPRADAADIGQAREETPAEPSARQATTERPARAARARTVAEAPVEMDKHTKARWRTNLQNAARKLAADRARVLESEDAWVDTVTDARDAGVPANVILAAAADADVELPE